MLQIMLCGAADTRDVRDEFFEVVTAFGGDPLHYQSGEILYLNSRDSSWEANSRLTVQEADICVFAIVRGFGHLTWRTELTAALADGKPFLILCLQETYEKYLTLVRSIERLDQIANSDDRELTAVLRELETERSLTVVPFRHGYFRDVLRRQLSALFDMSLRGLASRNRRAGVARLFHAPDRLAVSDLVLAREIATDEFEEKNIRKAAIDALALRGAGDEETVLLLIKSGEQGVQRRVIERLPLLLPDRPVAADFFEALVTVVNESDDVGLARRVVPVMLEMDLGAALRSLPDLSLIDIGLRRRLAQGLTRHQGPIEEHHVEALAASLLGRCLDGDDGDPDWKTKARALLERWREASSDSA